MDYLNRASQFLPCAAKEPNGNGKADASRAIGATTTFTADAIGASAGGKTARARPAANPESHCHHAQRRAEHERSCFFSRSPSSSKSERQTPAGEHSRCWHPQAGRYGTTRRRSDRTQCTSSTKAERRRLLRYFVQPHESRPFSRERFPPARKLRNRDARDSQFRA